MPVPGAVKDLKPDALFVFVPSGEGAAVLKQFTDRGLAAAGIRLICTGDVLDDDLMASIGPAAGSGQQPSLLGRASIGGEQSVRRGVWQSQQRHASELPLGRRL
jgi:hypothetical protein